MRRRSWKKVGLILSALLLVIAIGCQSVGGLDLNGMIMKQLEVTKQEQSQLLELEINFKEDLEQWQEEEPEMIELIKAFEKVSLQISHSKIDEQGRMWATGALSFGKGSIPFTIHIDKQAIRIDVDGVKRSLVIELPDFSAELGLENYGELERTLTDAVQQLIKQVASYFVKGLPNPPVITVDRVSEPVRGENINLTKVHAELNGKQLGELIPVYLDNLVNDQEGLREMLHNVFKWMTELPPEILELFGGGEMFDEEILDELVNEVFDALYPTLEEAQQELDSARNEEEWAEIFDEGITMNADLFVDDSLHLRKSLVEINIAPKLFEDEDSPLNSIKINYSSEMWNVNGNVEVPEVDVPWNALTPENLDELQPYQFLRLVDEDSILYGLLKHDFNIDDQSFFLSNYWGIPFFADEDGVAYVPIRATMSEFGVELQAPQTKGQIRFYDQATEQAVVLQIGSSSAFVNGAEVKLAHPVFNEGYYAYMSADDLFGILGAEYEVIEYWDDEYEMYVTREL